MKSLPDDAPLVLDTVALGHVALFKTVGQTLVADYRLKPNGRHTLLSWVSTVEIEVSTLNAGWGPRVRAAIQEGIEGARIVPLDSPAMVKAYIQIGLQLIAVGKHMGKHDHWIAATALVHNAWVLTADKGFTPLHESGMVRRILYDSKTGQRLD